MFKERHVSQESFDALLDWLDLNRETAGQKYERIRTRLIRIFVGRGCPEADYLADETLNRVASKFPDFRSVYQGEPALYFYGVAQKVHLEWLRKNPKFDPLEIELQAHSPITTVEKDCLDKCLDDLPDDRKTLIVDYYRGERAVKIENRRRLAEKMGLTISALQVRALRIRSQLRSCIEECARTAEM